MTQETVAIHFTYVVGGETKEGSTEVRARVEDVESKEGWERAARRCVFCGFHGHLATHSMSI